MPPLCPREDLVVEAVRVPAGDVRLEGELAYPEGEPVGAAVLAGPHPLLGGTMHNNVVRGLGDGLAQCGLATLRFNYRGAGGDPAAFWQTAHTPDEPHYLLDLQAACDFLRAAAGPHLPRALVGYSFGCSLLTGALPPGDEEVPLVLVAPTVGTHDYGGFAAARGPKLVIAPEGDFAADARALERWFAGLPGPKELVRPRLDSHFFRGHEDWLLATVGPFLDDAWR